MDFKKILDKYEKIELVMIRHGVTKGNLERRFIGYKSDISIMPEAVDSLREKEYPAADMIFSSPLKRCIETANVIYPGRKIQIIDNLREMDFGLFEGHNHMELNGNAIYQAWIDSGGRTSFPDGESMDEYRLVVMEGICELKRIAVENGVKRAAAVVHGGTIMAVCSYMGLSEYFDGLVGNGEAKTIWI